jgi:peroxidase
VLFSHPADFTPVCTTELGRIAVHKDHFKKRNVKILAHSVDEIKCHVDWVNDIKSYCPDICGDFPYPIIADPKRDLAVKFGMLDDKDRDNVALAQTVRALYIISPDKTIRLTMHYPTSCGRNVE